MRLARSAAALLCSAFAAPLASAETIEVPAEAPTIAAAIAQAQSGDEIVLKRRKYGEAIVLTGVSGVLIDGRGSTIDAGGTGSCVTLTNCTNVVVAGFKLKNAHPDADVVVVADSTGCTIKDCKVTGKKGDGSGIHVTGGGEVTLLRNKIKNTYYGIFLGEDGLETSDSEVEENVVLKVADCGIRASGSRNRILGNRVTKAGAAGITLRESLVNNDCNLLRGNTVTRAGSDGIRIGGTGAECEENTVKKAKEDAFRVLGSGHRFDDNVAKSPGDDGFLIDADGCTLRRNSVTSAKDDGYELNGDGGLFEDNTTTGAKDDGFDLSVGGTGNTLEDNTFGTTDP